MHKINRQRGVSLIEVLVSVLVLAIGLLGVAALQAASVRNTQSSYERSTAVVLTNSIIESMRTYTTQARAGAFALASCSAAGSSGVEQAQAQWVLNVKANLGPDTNCSISYTAVNNVYQITIVWDESRASLGGDTSLVTRVSI
jgi:type IV pilus assembly protein PilV